MDNKDLSPILKLYSEYDKVYGPYLRDDGRLHIVLNDSSKSKNIKGKTKTISYPKALKEIEINKLIKDTDTIHHKDWNVVNNLPHNLDIQPRKEHTKNDAIRVEVKDIKCPICGKMFTPTKAQTDKRNRNKPHFCSKECAGEYGASIQNNKIDKIPAQKIEKTYFKYI